MTSSGASHDFRRPPASPPTISSSPPNRTSPDRHATGELCRVDARSMDRRGASIQWKFTSTTSAPYPREASVEMIAPRAWHATLRETSRRPEIAFHAYGASGDVTRSRRISRYGHDRRLRITSLLDGIVVHGKIVLGPLSGVVQLSRLRRHISPAARRRGRPDVRPRIPTPLTMRFNAAGSDSTSSPW
jgi:hypothetical protein